MREWETAQTLLKRCAGRPPSGAAAGRGPGVRKRYGRAFPMRLGRARSGQLSTGLRVRPTSCARTIPSGCAPTRSASRAMTAGWPSASARNWHRPGFIRPTSINWPARSMCRPKRSQGKDSAGRPGDAGARGQDLQRALFRSVRTLEAARTRLLDYLANHAEINAATYRDVLAASRKFSISLLDYFDHAGVTTRGGHAPLRKA